MNNPVHPLYIEKLQEAVNLKKTKPNKKTIKLVIEIFNQIYIYTDKLKFVIINKRIEVYIQGKYVNNALFKTDGYLIYIRGVNNNSYNFPNDLLSIFSTKRIAIVLSNIIHGLCLIDNKNAKEFLNKWYPFYKLVSSNINNLKRDISGHPKNIYDLNYKNLKKVLSMINIVETSIDINYASVNKDNDSIVIHFDDNKIVKSIMSTNESIIKIHYNIPNKNPYFYSFYFYNNSKNHNIKELKKYYKQSKLIPSDL